MSKKYLIQYEKKEIPIEIDASQGDRLRITSEANTWELDVHQAGPNHYSILHNNHSYDLRFFHEEKTTHAFFNGERISFQLVDPRQAAKGPTASTRALREYEIGGFKTNIPFLRTLVEHPDFAKFNFYTRYIDDHPELLKKRTVELPPEWVFGLAIHDREQSKKLGVSKGTAPKEEAGVSLWKQMGMREGLR